VKNLTFHLKHEVPHLELLYRLFESIEGSEEDADWVATKPTG
jgi:hypothetical protein